MLLALAILGAVQASPINREPPFPIITVAQAASCVDPHGCRTLWNIVWSCLITILLCTWVSVRPNIPGPDEEWPKITLRRLGIMLATLIAPELMISWAIRQRVLAHELADKHKDHGWTVTHGFFALMGGFMEYNGNEPVRTLLPDQLEGYSLTGTGDFPRIAVEDIKDKSKGGLISKALILQTGWFIAQCIARASQGLPITELELVTSAFAVLNLVMFWLWWDKPLNVQRAVRVYKKQDIHMPSVEGAVLMKEGGFWLPLCRSLSTLCRSISTLPSSIADAWRDDPWTVVLAPIMIFSHIAGDEDYDSIVEDEKRIDTFYPPLPPIQSKSAQIVLFATPAIAMIFGALHCIAWSFAFPSDTERILWRVNSVLITGAPILLPLVVAMDYFDRPHSPGLRGLVGGYLQAGLALVTMCLVLLCGFAYPIARVFLLVLPFLSLRALPAEAYLSVHWTTLIPHI